MAYMTNTLQGYSHDETTVREDLSDIITILSPTDMPLWSILAHVPIHQRQFDWSMDDIPFDETIAGIASATRTEGKDAIFPSPDHRSRIYNVAQINSLAWDIADTARVVDMAGVDDEFDYQGLRKMLQLGRVMEYAAHFGTGVDAAAGDTQSSTARVTEGLVNWIAKGGLHRTAGATSFTQWTTTTGPTVTSDFFSTFYDAAGTDLSRTILYNNILAPAWKAGFKPNGAIGLCGSKLKQFITGFAIASGTDYVANDRNISAEARTLHDTIDVVVTNLGTIYVNLDRYLDNTQNVSWTETSQSPDVVTTSPVNEIMVMIEPRYWQLGILRPMGFKPLAPVGDSTKGMLIAEWGLKALNPIAGCGGCNLVY